MSDEPPNKHETSLSLPSGYSVEAKNTPEGFVISAPDGRVCLTITLGPDGLRVAVEAASLAIASKGEISLAADKLVLGAKGDLTLVAGGDIALQAEGAIRSTAFEHHLTATTGDICIDANDDVKLEGERIRLNAPDLAPLRRVERGKGQTVSRPGADEEPEADE